MSNDALVSAPVAPPGSAGARRVFSRSDLVILASATAASVVAGLLTYVGSAPAVLRFGVSAIAIATLASLVGRCVERLGDRLGAGATGVLQSALGNLPELFIAFFALRKGLLSVVQAAIIGSILANLLLVLGAAFIVGGLKHGTQRFAAGPARTNVVLLALATSALVLPSMAAQTHTKAAQHITALSVAVAIVLLAVFALSLPQSLRRRQDAEAEDTSVGNAVKAIGREDAGHHEGHWPIWLAVCLLAAAGVAAGLVSDWFVNALQPAIDAMHISQTFAGLVIVAIAGNAVENFVGIQLAARNQADYALSVIVNSPLQIALVLAPALVLLSFLTATTLTLVFSPLLVICVVVSVLVVSLIVTDGESNWLEGVILVALYAIIAAMFWWG